MDFTHPIWLWLLPPLLLWVLWWARRSDVEVSGGRGRTALALRILGVCAVVFALAGMRWLQPVEGMNVLFLLDRSQSVPETRQQQILEWVEKTVREKPRVDQAGLVVFGADVGIEAAPDPAPDLKAIHSVVSPARTDIASAIRLAAALFPEHGQRRMVLLSDGNENAGNAIEAAASIKATDIHIDVVPLDTDRGNDIALQRLLLPSRVKKGQTFEAKVFVQADQPGVSTVRLFRNNRILGEQKVSLQAGKNLFTFPQTLAESGFYGYDVQIDSPSDEVPQNNRAYGFVDVLGQPRVLVVSSDPATDAPLIDALQSPEVEVRLVGVSGFPASLDELQSYDSVIFSNVSAGDLGREQLAMMESAVRDFGSGFVCIGGDQSFAAGGYRGTPLADMLPVDVEISSKRVLPSGALVLVIDRSGSMSGEKFDMARQAAAAAVQALAPSDYVGVIAFSESPEVVVDMQQAGDREAIVARILGLGMGGGTAMYPAMEQARAMLQGVSASYKHCVLLTDGVSVPGDFEGITAAMAGERVTVSTIGIGFDLDQDLLARIAGLGKGRFYNVPNPGQLPQIFIKEAMLVLKAAIREEAIVPVLSASTEPVRGITGYPRLAGHVLSELRPRAETPLLTDKGDPLLAHWQYGLGRVVAFTSDARSKWARDWVSWSQYRQFWGQVTRWSLRKVENSSLAAQISSERGVARLAVEAVGEQGEFRNFLDLRAHIVGPGVEKRTVHLSQTGPGQYEVSFPLEAAGGYLVNLMEHDGDTVRASQRVGVSLNYAPELETTAPNLQLLSGIADMTGGKIIQPARPGSSPFFDDRRKTARPHDLWDWLLKAAVVLLVLDIGVRRVDPDPEYLAMLRKYLPGFLAVLLPRRNGPAAEAPIGDLLAARAKTRVRTAPAPMPAQTPPATASAAAPPTIGPDPAVVEESSAAESTDRLLEAKRRSGSRWKK